MNKNEQFVITINRELGSGGRTVGRMLAEKLGVPFYDKAVIKALQEKYNLTTAEIERLKGRKHSWWADVERILKIDGGMSMNYYLPQKSDAPDLITTDEMFKTETLLLQDLAAEKSCVVAGRSGFHIVFSANALEKLGDYGTVTIKTSGSGKPSASVISDERIVYNVPMQ